MVGLWVISGFFPFIFINYSIRDMCYLHNMFLSFFYYFRRVFEILKIILQHSDIQVDQQPVNKRTFSSLRPGLGLLVSGRKRPANLPLAGLSLSSCSWIGQHGEEECGYKEEGLTGHSPGTEGKTKPCRQGIWLLMITPSIHDVCLYQKGLNDLLTYVHSIYCIQETFTNYLLHSRYYIENKKMIQM